MANALEPARQVARATAVVLAMTLVSRVLGFLRDAAIAWAFGASRASDAYMVAYTLPYFLQSVLGVALVTVMVPVVSRHLVAGTREEAWSVTSSILNLTGIFLLVLTVIGYWGAAPLIGALAPGFSQEQAALAVQLTRIMFPSLAFVGLGMLISGVLNAGFHFSIPAFAPGLANLVMILAVVFFHRRLFIHALAWGTLAGFAAFFLVQLPSLRALGFRYRWHWHFRHPDVRRVLRHVPTVLLAISVTQIYLAINRLLASGLPHGSITALDLANRVVNLPLGVFATSLSTALFPAMSRQAARHELEGLAAATAKSLAVLLVVVLPVSTAMVLLREPLIRLLFQRGVFDAAATALTAEALFYFAFGMVGVAANLVLTRTSYALGEVGMPVLAAGISIAADAGLSVLLVGWLAHGGLALANSLATTLNAALLFFLLRRHLPGLHPLPLARTGVLALVACVPTGVALSLGLILWPPAALGPKSLVLEVLALTTLGAGIFLGTARTLRLTEVDLLLASGRKVIFGRRER